MPITPPIFLCYGRPDSTYAAALGAELFRRGIESFNYQIRPVEDRWALEVPYESYLLGCQVFVAIITSEAAWREKVWEELLAIMNLKRAGVQRSVVYITTPLMLDEFPIPPVADCVVDMARVGGPDRAVNEIAMFLGQEYLDQCGQKLELNRALFPSETAALDTELRSQVFLTDGMQRGDALLRRYLDTSPIGVRITDDLTRMSAAQNRSHFAHILADVLSFVDPEAASIVTSKAQFPRVGRIGAKWDVPKKDYGESERLNLDSQVIRGLARIANALGALDVRYARDVSRRIGWHQTQLLAELCVYACAVSIGVADVALEVQSALANGETGVG